MPSVAIALRVLLSLSYLRLLFLNIGGQLVAWVFYGLVVPTQSIRFFGISDALSCFILMTFGGKGLNELA